MKLGNINGMAKYKYRSWNEKTDTQSLPKQSLSKQNFIKTEKKNYFKKNPAIADEPTLKESEYNSGTLGKVLSRTILPSIDGTKFNEFYDISHDNSLAKL